MDRIYHSRFTGSNKGTCPRLQRQKEAEQRFHPCGHLQVPGAFLWTSISASPLQTQGVHPSHTLSPKGMALSQSPLSLGLPSSKQVFKAHLLNEWMSLHLSATLHSAAFRQEPHHKQHLLGESQEDGGSGTLILGSNQPQTQELWDRLRCSPCPFYPPPRPTQGPWRTSRPDPTCPESAVTQLCLSKGKSCQIIYRKERVCF